MIPNKSSLLIVILCFYCVKSSVFKRAITTYDTKYDNIGVKRIVESKRLLLNYANCLLDKGPCTPEGTMLKTYLPDAMQTNCAKCTDKQKEISGTIIGHLVHNYKDLYEQLLQKYDPDGSFRRQMEGGGEEDEDDEQNK